MENRAGKAAGKRMYTQTFTPSSTEHRQKIFSMFNNVDCNMQADPKLNQQAGDLGFVKATESVPGYKVFFKSRFLSLSFVLTTHKVISLLKGNWIYAGVSCLQKT